MSSDRRTIQARSEPNVTARPEQLKASGPSLTIRIVPLRDLPITVLAPGKYEVALLTSGEVVASDALISHQL